MFEIVFRSSRAPEPDQGTALEWFTAIADLLSAFFWPACAFLVVLLFRRNISNLLMKMRKADWNGASVTFEEDLQRSKDLADSIAPPASHLSLPRPGSDHSGGEVMTPRVGGDDSTVREPVTLDQIPEEAPVSEEWAKTERYQAAIAIKRKMRAHMLLSYDVAIAQNRREISDPRTRLERAYQLVDFVIKPYGPTSLDHLLDSRWAQESVPAVIFKTHRALRNVLKLAADSLIDEAEVREYERQVKQFLAGLEPYLFDYYAD